MKRNISKVLVGAMILSSISFGSLAQSFAASFTDVNGHWAESYVSQWTDKDYVKGYQDGTFKPNNLITRAEFMTIVNKAFGYNSESEINFSDVKSSDWFYKEVKKAVAAGYISGYENMTMMPNKTISRQEAAVIIAKIKKLEASKESSFTDNSSIASWAKKSVDSLVENKIMAGYPDGSFKPNGSITRAESIVALDKALKLDGAVNVPEGTITPVLSKPGTYGPEKEVQTYNGDVTIKSKDVTLRNVVIKGNLIIDETVGDGDVKLQNVKVEGNTDIRGGGANTVTLENCEFVKVTVDKANNSIRILLVGATGIEQLVAASGVNVEGQGSTYKIGNMTIQAGVNGDIKINGLVDKLVVDAPVKITLAENAVVRDITFNAAAKVEGKGTIQIARVNVDGVKTEVKFSQEISKEGVKPAEVTTPSGGGGGGGGGSSTNSNLTTSSAINLFLAALDKDTIGDVTNIGTSSVTIKMTHPEKTIQQTINAITQKITSYNDFGSESGVGSFLTANRRTTINQFIQDALNKTPGSTATTRTFDTAMNSIKIDNRIGYLSTLEIKVDNATLITVDVVNNKSVATVSIPSGFNKNAALSTYNNKSITVKLNNETLTINLVQ